MGNIRQRLLGGLLVLGLTLAPARALLPVRADADSAAQREARAAETADGTAGESGTGGGAAPEEDREGTVSFQNLRERVRAGSLDARILGESIASLEELDYDVVLEHLRAQMNDNSSILMVAYFNPLAASSLGIGTQTIAALEAANNALREQYDDILDGTTQKDNADLARQLRHTQNLVLFGAETLYLSVLEAEAGRETLVRNLDALDRRVQELELRHARGQVSDLTLSQATVARENLSSQLETLDMNLATLRKNLERMLGLPPEGTLRLLPLPELPEAFWEELDAEADLERAKAQSYELYDAEKTLKDARKEWLETSARYQAPWALSHYVYEQAQHTWNAAQFSYQNTVEGFEDKFDVLSRKIADCVQILAAAEAALEAQEAEYRAQELRYAQGSISLNARAAALDDVGSARDSVTAARRNLFSAWNSYRWAVEYGILN